MTSITLPFKEFPGQTQKVSTFFGGRSLVAPMILLLTTPYTLYLYYHLSGDSLLSYNLIGLLPYLWGCISIAGYIKKSDYSVEELFEADLGEAERIFDKTKNYFRSLLISNIVFSIIIIIVFTYSLLVFGTSSLLYVGLSSITSIELAFASIFSHNVKGIFIYICLVCASEAAFLLMTFRGLWMFDLILLVGSLLILFLCLRRIERYGLRSFFERVVN